MLLDARFIASGEVITADVCIIGGGPAGLSVALGLKQRGLRVVLLESGGLNPDDGSQDLYRGTVTGRAYYALDACRLRYLGGSSNFWGGWCRPLDGDDLEARDWVPHSGWPITKRDLDRYYAPAHDLCKLGPYNYDPQFWRDATHSVPSERASSSALRDTVFQIEPIRFGREYRHELERASHLQLLLHANAIELETAAGQTSVNRVRAGTIAGNEFAVVSRMFVLAAGGIENPRLLLASRRRCPCGIGNEHDLVGRFFAEHLHVPVGIVRPTNPLSFYRERRAKGARIRGGMSLSAEVRRERRLLGSGLTFHNCDDPHDVLSPTRMPPGYESLRVLMKAAGRRERPARVWHHAANVVTGLDTVATLAYRKVVKPRVRALMVGCRAEQAPNPASRVTLDDSTDHFGMPRARLHWQLTERDIASFNETLRIWPRELAALGEVEEFFPDGEDWLEKLSAGAHHIGTTRMHRDPRCGVVDEHCRVHSVRNLYVAGSSVFPTAGWAPPTLTIVALALRLADHLAHVSAS